MIWWRKIKTQTFCVSQLILKTVLEYNFQALPPPRENKNRGIKLQEKIANKGH